jgi:hypothetical protein
LPGYAFEMMQKARVSGLFVETLGIVIAAERICSEKRRLDEPAVLNLPAQARS